MPFLEKDKQCCRPWLLFSKRNFEYGHPWRPNLWEWQGRGSAKNSWWGLYASGVV